MSEYLTEEEMFEEKIPDIDIEDFLTEQEMEKYYERKCLCNEGNKFDSNCKIHEE